MMLPSDIDKDILPLVEALNKGGIPTSASCSGHNKRLGYVWLEDNSVLIIVPSANSEKTKRIVDALTYFGMRLVELGNYPDDT